MDVKIHKTNMLAGIGSAKAELMTEESVRMLLGQGLERFDLAGKRLLVIIPDGTRSGPIGLLFRLLHEFLVASTDAVKVEALDYLIALGTHMPMSETAIQQHLGVTAEDLSNKYAGVRIFNHAWNKQDTFKAVGVISAAEIEELSGGRFAQPVTVTVNKLVFDYDLVLVCGPVFPHEVAGFSGGNKYFFPGISGPEVINFTHWLGALITSYKIIGTRDTPVRAVIDRAASMIDVPVIGCCFVVKGGGLAGLYVGSIKEAWSQAAELSKQVHIRYVSRPFRKVISVMPQMYDDLWTAAKGMYKLEPVVADDGEVIIYAPHINEVSYVHGHILDTIGYHVRDYFVKQWDQFNHLPWGVLAHSTHLRGTGTFEAGVEQPRIKVTLATLIPAERCRRLNLGYRDPSTIDLDQWRGREDEGILVVPKAGELLYRLRDEAGQSSVGAR